MPLKLTCLSKVLKIQQGRWSFVIFLLSLLPPTVITVEMKLSKPATPVRGAPTITPIPLRKTMRPLDDRTAAVTPVRADDVWVIAWALLYFFPPFDKEKFHCRVLSDNHKSFSSWKTGCLFCPAELDIMMARSEWYFDLTFFIQFLFQTSKEAHWNWSFHHSCQSHKFWSKEFDYWLIFFSLRFLSTNKSIFQKVFQLYQNNPRW